jgi:hypothetical protein
MQPHFIRAAGFSAAVDAFALTKMGLGRANWVLCLTGTALSRPDHRVTQRGHAAVTSGP